MPSLPTLYAPAQSQNTHKIKTFNKNMLTTAPTFGYGLGLFPQMSLSEMSFFCLS